MAGNKDRNQKYEDTNMINAENNTFLIFTQGKRLFLTYL